jgi:hypothetical protein
LVNELSVIKKKVKAQVDFLSTESSAITPNPDSARYNYEFAKFEKTYQESPNEIKQNQYKFNK